MKNQTLYLVKGSIFLAFGIIVPQIFHLAGLAGPIFLPMHFPVLLCGFILGPKMGLAVGVITPIVSSFLTGMPVLFPMGIIMMFELATYGVVAGYLYNLKNQNIVKSLVLSMVSGRIVSGCMNFILLTATGKGFVLTAFITASFVTSSIGILLQLIIIPIIVNAFSFIQKNKTDFIDKNVPSN